MPTSSTALPQRFPNSLEMMRRIAPLLYGSGSLFLAMLSLSLSVAPARATALTGSFDLLNWTLDRYQGGNPQGPTYGTLYDSLRDISGLCVNVNDLSCVYMFNEEDPPVVDTTSDPARFAIVGSSNPTIGGPDQAIYIAWTLAYNGPSGTLSFDRQFNNLDGGSTDFGYIQLNNSFKYYDSSDQSDPVGDSIVLANGDTLTFGVYTTDNSGDPGVLSITGFQFTPTADVPAPLPLLGAGAAFGWSRRLRRRIRTQAGVAVR